MLDREVHASDPLIELDTLSEKLQLDEATEKLTANNRQLEFLKKELSEEAAAQYEDRNASRAALAVSQAHERDAIARSKLAVEESNRFGVLRENGHVGEMEALRAATEATGRKSAAGEMVKSCGSRSDQAAAFSV